VFLVEPQWNPSVENQAIARALRLGQEQAVLVTRYVVDQSVELVRLLVYTTVLVC
jgi:SWI/SNF-related matrix-associated actin-dependent regulator of chromatin subfamily A3